VYVSTLLQGGPVSHLRDLVPAAKAAGADVHVVCASPVVAAEFEGRAIGTTIIPVNSKFDLAGAAALRRPLAAADVVHTHDRRAGLFGRLIARAQSAGVIHTLHGVPERVALELGPPNCPTPGRSVRDRATLGAEALLARLGEVVIPSQALADFVVRHGFPQHRIHVIPSGVVVQRRDPGPLGRPPVVGTAATLDHHKGVDVLLEGCALIEEPLTVEIFGDGPARPELEALAARLGVAATFHGFVEDFRDRIGGLDVFVLPTRGDNLPVVILEAMANAVPVVATRVGGIPELVVDGESGVLVPPDDPAAIARACEGVIASEGLRTRLARGGVRRIEQHFELQDVAKRVVALYEQVLQR
jgi:glycosyltransferase involved in cell wall biosynthesis